MKTLEREFRLTMSKGKNIPCLWEEGGALMNRGEAQIIANWAGKPAHALFVNRRGNLACGQHALVPVAKGYFIIEAKHKLDVFVINIYEINDINVPLKKAYADLVHSYDGEDWDDRFDEQKLDFFNMAIIAARSKAQDLHCEKTYYVEYTPKDKIPQRPEVEVANEVLVGEAVPFEDDEDVPEDSPGWTLSVEITPVEVDRALTLLGYTKIRDSHREQLIAFIENEMSNLVTAVLEEPDRFKLKKGALGCIS